MPRGLEAAKLSHSVRISFASQGSICVHALRCVMSAMTSSLKFFPVSFGCGHFVSGEA